MHKVYIMSFECSFFSFSNSTNTDNECLRILASYESDTIVEQHVFALAAKYIIIGLSVILLILEVCYEKMYFI